MAQLEIRKASADDLQALQDVAAGMKSAKDVDYFQQSLAHQDVGERLVLLIEYDGQVVGYGMLSWAPKYAYYKTMGYPETQDLNVLPTFRGKGIATAFIKHCEDLALQKGLHHMGISVGLTASYGAAQRLYVKLGYVPDGHGVTYDRKAVSHAEFKPVDDDLCLMMVKDLQNP